MRRTVLTLLVFLCSASSCHLVNRVALHNTTVRNVKQGDDVLRDRIDVVLGLEDVLGERFLQHPLHLKPVRTLCAAADSASALVEVGCGGGHSRPEQMALRTPSSSVRNHGSSGQSFNGTNSQGPQRLADRA